MNFQQHFTDQHLNIFKGFATDSGTYQKTGDPLTEPVADVYANIENNTEQTEPSPSTRRRGTQTVIKITFSKSQIARPKQGDTYATENTVYEIRDILSGDNLSWQVHAVIQNA